MGLVGCKKMADKVGRENRGRRKKYEMRKNGGRKGLDAISKDTGASLVDTLCVLQGAKEAVTLPMAWSKGANTNGTL
jgi:hypothetical protein